MPESELAPLDALVQFSFLVQGVVARAGAEHDLSLSQLRLLGILRDRDAGMLELAAFLGVDKSSVTGLIDRAEKRALVRRTRAACDGRALRVSMTDRGLALADIVAGAVQQGVAALTEALSPAEQARLAALTGAVVEAAANFDPKSELRPER